MVSFVPEFLFTATVTAPAFLPLGLIGITKDSKNYFQHWNNLLENGVILTFSLSYLFQKNYYKCDIAPSLQLACMVFEPVQYASVRNHPRVGPFNAISSLQSSSSRNSSSLYIPLRLLKVTFGNTSCS